MYQSPKAQQHADGRDALRRQVDSIVRGMTPLHRHVTYRLNPVTGRMVEVR